jgi:hypothetical protein
MGDQHKTKQTTGTNGQAGSMQSGDRPGKSDDKSRGQGQYQGQGLNKDQGTSNEDTGQGEWNDRAQRPMQQGDDTRPTQPTGTSPLDKDQQSGNQKRPVTQNR